MTSNVDGWLTDARSGGSSSGTVINECLSGEHPGRESRGAAGQEERARGVDWWAGGSGVGDGKEGSERQAESSLHLVASE